MVARLRAPGRSPAVAPAAVRGNGCRGASQDPGASGSDQPDPGYRKNTAVAIVRPAPRQRARSREIGSSLRIPAGRPAWPSAIPAPVFTSGSSWTYPSIRESSPRLACRPSWPRLDSGPIAGRCSAVTHAGSVRRRATTSTSVSPTCSSATPPSPIRISSREPARLSRADRALSATRRNLACRVTKRSTRTSSNRFALAWSGNTPTSAAAWGRGPNWPCHGLCDLLPFELRSKA